MAARAGYHTKQQEELLNYLKASEGEHVTAAQIREALVQTARPIGMATIYRHLENFVQEGMVKKYLLDTGDSACYEYNGAKEECRHHFHCKCEKCGRLIHLNCGELLEIQDHLLKEYGFSWNAGKTVFYGICDQCRV